METARLSKRVWAYIINLLICVGIGFGSAIPFLTLLNLHIIFYILIGIGFSFVLSFAFGSLIMSVSHGYNIGSAILGIRYVASDGKKLTVRQVIVRSFSESIVILVILDLIYFIKNRTERGVIDRLTSSFAIDTRI